jgi:hypothetical protein
MRVNAGADFQSRVMGGDTLGDSGTSTGTTATTLTDSGKAWTVNGYTGHVVVTASTYGVVASNTATALTIDKWYTAGSPGGAAASTPGTGVYVLLPGGQPAFWMAVTTDSAAPGATDTTLASELSGSGWTRAVATYAHTTAASSYTLTKTFTSADGTSRTLNKMAILNSSTGGTMVFESAIPFPPTLVSGDTITITETVNI